MAPNDGFASECAVFCFGLPIAICDDVLWFAGRISLMASLVTVGRCFNEQHESSMHTTATKPE